jgi:ABC-type antimicrobial peptide transport system permease subunit
LLVGGGIVVGTVATIWVTRFIGSLLFDVTPRDPTIMGGAVAVLCAIGAIAGFLPARRAARIDPAQVLREG